MSYMMAHPKPVPKTRRRPKFKNMAHPMLRSRTKLGQILTLITMASATVMHAATNHLVDAVLALILMVGGVIGAQFGARTGQKMRGERLRLLLGLLVFAVGLRFAWQLVVQPDDIYSLRMVGIE